MARVLGEPVRTVHGGVVMTITRVRVADTEWMEQAACKGIDTDLFYPEVGESAYAGLVKRVCRECLVREACLSYALRMVDLDGIWGGMTARERGRMRRKAMAA